jgi:hypothetical protein
VEIAWTLPPPTVATGTPTALTATTATLTGEINPNGSQVTDCHFAIAPAPSGGRTIPCPQQIGGGSAPVAVAAPVGGLAPGVSYTATLLATSAQGTSEGLHVPFTTPATSGSAGAGLTVSELRLSASRFRRGRRAATISGARRAPNVTTISFTLSAAATVSIGFERAEPGVLRGSRCLARTRAHRGGRPCNRYAAVGRGVSRAAGAGARRVLFDGVLDGGSRLVPGRYRITLSATLGAARASAPQRPTFTLLSP